MTAVPWRWNTGKGRGGLGLRANSAFGNNIFMDCGRMCFVPAVMEPGPGMSDGKWENIGKTAKQKNHTENWLFTLFWTVRVMWKNTSFAPSHLSNIFDNEVWSQERKGTCWEVFSLQFWTKPVPSFFHLQSRRKMFFFPQLGCKCFPDCFYLCKKTCEDLGRFCELIKSHISWALSFSLNSPSILSGIQYTNDNFLA